MNTPPKKAKVQNRRFSKRKRFGELDKDSGNLSPRHAAAGHGTGGKGITGASPPASNSQEETSEGGLMGLSFLPNSQAQPQMEPRTPQLKGERAGRKAEAQNNGGGASTQNAVLTAFFDNPEAKPKSAVLDAFFDWTPPSVEVKKEDKEKAQEAQPELVVQGGLPKAPEEDVKPLIEGENQEDQAWHNQAYLESLVQGSPLRSVTKEVLLSEFPFYRVEQGSFQDVSSSQTPMFPFKLESRFREEPDTFVTPSKTCDTHMLMSGGAIGGLQEQCNLPHEQYAVPRGQYAIPHGQYAMPHVQCDIPHGQCAIPHVQCNTPHVQYAIAHEQSHVPHMGCDMVNMQKLQYVPQHVLHDMPKSPYMKHHQHCMSDQHGLPFVPCGMAPHEAGKPYFPNVEACVTEGELLDSFGDLPGDSFGGMEAGGRDGFQETVGTPFLDTIHQMAVNDHGEEEGAPEFSSDPKATVPKDKSQRIKWTKHPAKMLGEPGVTVDSVAAYPGDWSYGREWKDIPGVQRNDELILDEGSILEFKRAQADFRRTVNLCVEKEMARVQASHGLAQPALKAMREFDEWIFQEPIIGHLPGLAINTTFQYKAEMHVLGVHKSHSRGISYVSAQKAKPGVPIALSICMSSQHAFDEDHFQEAWYTGAGGNLAKDYCKKPRKGQELTGGNEALMNNIRLRLPVRVVKKLSNKQFVYDGIWDVVDWVMGKDYGKMVYKFKLKRRLLQALSCQEAPFHGEEPAPVVDFNLGAITDDLSYGKEINPIPVVNTMDWELAPGIQECASRFSGPADEFEYGVEFKYSLHVDDKVAPPRPLVYKLQVFRKAELDDDGLGWGVRTLEHIAKNSYILTLVGQIIHLDHDVVEDDDVHCHNLYMKTDMQDSESKSEDIGNREITYAVSAYSYGNVGRFVDHNSTSPNTLLQPTFSRDPSVGLTNMCLYAIADIQPGEEITYDQFKTQEWYFETDDEDGFE